MMDKVAREWHDKLLETLAPHRTHPLLLSGGLDSGTLLAGLLELGARPQCVSFRLGGTDSRDAATARAMCATFGLPLHVLEIPRSNLISDVRTLIPLMGTARKTAVQCVQPVWYMMRWLKGQGYNSAIIGTGAICVDNREASVILRQQGEAAARAYRTLRLDDKFNDTAVGHEHRLGRMLGVVLCEPFSEEPLRSYALSLDMAELNKPCQKGIAVRAFPEFWGHGWYRKNSPLQVNSGVREWHDELLRSPLNVRGARSVVAIYNDVLAGRV